MQWMGSPGCPRFHTDPLLHPGAFICHPMFSVCALSYQCTIVSGLLFPTEVSP